jgi:cellulose synthase/poly-beta-1,6-N-acetylglucosamine synthase-like glycosyltransferase
MLAQRILIDIFIFGVITTLFFTLFSQFGAIYYDLSETLKEKDKKKHPYLRKYRDYRPTLSIIIPAHNEEAVIKRCLSALIKSTYRKIEIIVADDASTDGTKRVVKDFITENPRFDIKLVAKWKNGGRGAAIDAGLSKTSGELVMALDADCVVDRLALRNMVRHFIDKEVVAVAANIRIIKSDTVVSLLQEFDYLSSFRSKKVNTMFKCEHIVGGAGATYRTETLKKIRGFDHTMQTEDIELSLRIARVLGSKKHRLVYASDVVVHTEPVPSYKSLFKQRYRWKFGSLQAIWSHRRLLFSFDRKHSMFLSWVRLPYLLISELMLLIEPVLLTYFLYLAIVYRNPTLFAVATITISSLLFVAIWSDEHHSFRYRLRLSFYAPTMYLIFYLMTVIQILAATKCVRNVNQLIGNGNKYITGAYISPERIG